MKRIVFIITSFVIMQSSLVLGQDSIEDNKQPNILFILADDLGINALNCYGNSFVESPNIDQLYAEGMHFTNGYASDPTCAPSRATILSGQYIPRHRVYRVADRYINDKKTLHAMKYLPPAINAVKGSGSGLGLEKVTIAEALKANGYATAAFGKWHLGKKQLQIKNQGFDEGFEILGHYNFKTSPEQKNLDSSLYASDLVTERTIDFIKRSAAKDQPFFAYVPYYLVHKPLEPKPEDLEYVKARYKGNNQVGKDEISVLAMIKALDDIVGILMNALKDLNIEDNTIVVFTSDNGHYKTESNIFTKPYRGVKGQTLEGGIRVPYIFKWKHKIKPGSVSEEPIINVDLYPTFLGLVNAEAPENYILDGEDISPVLLGNTTSNSRDALIWEYTNYANYNVKQKTFASKWVNVIQMKGYKLTEDVDTGTYTLYNLNKDPYETKNIATEAPEILQVLVKRLERWKRETEYEGPRPNPDYEKR
ncbi:sulfatase [Snuella sedimenti]|uniref:Sulfatase n=1 Tax=Snuella sedimenti TaxID=2798802 RepID=A0A8J7J4Q4_9FLAO|nr:sulfatase [Snuella sedimenti]MBJ6368513.1 sulfatase [Snuella sedimenti]